MVDDMDRAPLTLRHQCGHLGLHTPAPEFEAAELVGEGTVGQLRELIDNGGQHEFMVANR